MLRLVFFIVLLCSTLAAVAQETTAEITGIVADDEGAVAKATVSALHTPTGTLYSTTTRKDGRYNLPNLKVGGPYTIKVNFIGYKEEIQEGVTLLLGQPFKADFVLTEDFKILDSIVIGSLTKDKIFNSNRTGSQEIVNRTQIEVLPNTNRSLKDFVRLTPFSNGLSFGGQNGLFNNISIDGINFNSAFGNTTTQGVQIASTPVGLETIEQIQINIAPFDVKQSGFTGAGINAVSRGGSNAFKSSLYSYYSSPGTQGYKVGTTTLEKDTFTYNMKGLYVSGPIIKNKLFFFINGEQEILNTPATSFIASDATHQPGGNVSNASAENLNELKQFLIDRYSYDPGEFQGYRYKTKKQKFSVKIDWNINIKNTFTFKYTYSVFYKENPAGNSGAPGSRQPSLTGLPFSKSGFSNDNHFNIFIAELNTRFSNRGSNKIQLGYAMLRNSRSSLGGKVFPFVDILNGQGQSYTAFGYEPLSYNNIFNTNVYQLVDIFTFYKGKHEFNFGTQDYIKLYKTGFAPNYTGSYRFNSIDDFYNSAKDSVPNALIYNLQYSLTKDGSFPYSRIGSTELGFFAQDKWTISKNFNLNYGLRADIPIFHNTFMENPYVPLLTFRNGAHYDVGAKPGTSVLISPRIGFNWISGNKRKIQLRGGIGIYTGPPPFIWLSNQASNNGVQFGSFSRKRLAFSPDINAYRPEPSESNTSYNVVFIDKKLKYLQALKTCLAIDITLPEDIVATVEATYIKDIHSIYFQNVNLPVSGQILAGSDPRFRFDSSRIYSGNPTPTNSNPNLENAVLITNSKKGYGYALTLQLQKTISDFLFSAAYTFSAAKTINDGGSQQAALWRDKPVTNDPNAEELGYADFYLPHRIIAYASYRKEYAKRFATSIGLIFEAAPSGVGSYTYNGDINNDGITADNDLMYIPKNKDDIILVPVNTGVGGPIYDRRTPDQIWAQLNNFINQDRYLSGHRGQLAQRNAAVFPFFKRLDINITQDFYFATGKQHKDKHTLRLTFDLINAGNFLNKNWGTYKIFTLGNAIAPYQSSFLKYEGLVPNGGLDQGKPRFSFPYLDPVNLVPLVNSYTNDTSILSRWLAQIGIRYIFQ